MSDNRITVDELDAIFGGRVPVVAMKLLYPEKSNPLTTDEMRTILRALAPSPDATLLAAEMQRRAVERAKADAEMCMESAAKAEAEGHDSAADQDRQAAHVARGIAAAIAALDLPTSALAAAMQLPEVRAMRAVCKRLTQAVSEFEEDGHRDDLVTKLIGAAVEAKSALAALEGKV